MPRSGVFCRHTSYGHARVEREGTNIPCNTVILNTVELETAGKNAARLKTAIESEFGGKCEVEGSAFMFLERGLTVRIENGAVRSPHSETDLQKIVGRIKQAYSRETVASAMKRFGWAKGKSKNSNNFVIVKR